MISGYSFSRVQGGVPMTVQGDEGRCDGIPAHRLFSVELRGRQK